MNLCHVRFLVTLSTGYLATACSFTAEDKQNAGVHTIDSAPGVNSVGQINCSLNGQAEAADLKVFSQGLGLEEHARKPHRSFEKKKSIHMDDAPQSGSFSLNLADKSGFIELDNGYFSNLRIVDFSSLPMPGGPSQIATDILVLSESGLLHSFSLSVSAAKKDYRTLRNGIWSDGKNGLAISSCTSVDTYPNASFSVLKDPRLKKHPSQPADEANRVYRTLCETAFRKVMFEDRNVEVGDVHFTAAEGEYPIQFFLIFYKNVGTGEEKRIRARFDFDKSGYDCGIAQLDETLTERDLALSWP